MADATAPPISGWEKAVMAAERVKERMRRATRALDAAGVPYAVVGGNAVAEWVGRVDDAVVRNTQDVDILVRRADLDTARAAMEAAAAAASCRSASITSGVRPVRTPGFNRKTVTVPRVISARTATRRERHFYEENESSSH